MVSCTNCGRTLTNLTSVSARMGPICRKKIGMLELKEEALALAKSEPIDLETEIEIYKALNKHNTEIHGSMEHTFARKEKQLEKAGWDFVREFSIHFPERLEQTLKELSQNYRFKAVVYDSVENGKSRLIVNLWSMSTLPGFDSSQTLAKITGIKKKPKKQTFSQYLNSTLDQFIGGN